MITSKTLEYMVPCSCIWSYQLETQKAHAHPGQSVPTTDQHNRPTQQTDGGDTVQTTRSSRHNDDFITESPDTLYLQTGDVALYLLFIVLLDHQIGRNMKHGGVGDLHVLMTGNTVTPGSSSGGITIHIQRSITND